MINVDAGGVGGVGGEGDVVMGPTTGSPASVAESRGDGSQRATGFGNMRVSPLTEGPLAELHAAGQLLVL